MCPSLCIKSSSRVLSVEPTPNIDAQEEGVTLRRLASRDTRPRFSVPRSGNIICTRRDRYRGSSPLSRRPPPVITYARTSLPASGGPITCTPKTPKAPNKWHSVSPLSTVLHSCRTPRVYSITTHKHHFPAGHEIYMLNNHLCAVMDTGSSDVLHTMPERAWLVLGQDFKSCAD